MTKRITKSRIVEIQAMVLTEKGYDYLAELARKRKPVVITQEEWDRFYVPKKAGAFIHPIDGDPNLKGPMGKPAYFTCTYKGQETCVYLKIDSDYEARKIAAIELKCEPGQVQVKGPFLTKP